jgi:metal-dependent amidase/aminoacylase/carboxypeptidase family protein
MKQEIVTYLSTIKDTLSNISKYIYDNPEESFHESKAVECIKNVLKENNFKIKENFMEIPTSFYAEYGSGHPKICFICEYDEIKGKGHLTGHNLMSAMSLGGALGLSKVIDKHIGSIIVLGCPGEYLGSSKLTMVKQGVFNDIDVVLMAHPHIVTGDSSTSPAILPISIKYTGKDSCNCTKDNTYSALDACMFTLTGLNHLTKGFSKDVSLEGIIVNGGNSASITCNSSESKFCISASSIKSAQQAEVKINELVNLTSSLMNIDSKISYYEFPYEALLTNATLSRLFSHNLKQQGIIDYEGTQYVNTGLSTGNVSHVVPCIHHYVCISEDKTISYCSEEFSKATLTPYALERMLHTAEALAITGLDLISKEELLNEIRDEFYSNIKTK